MTQIQEASCSDGSSGLGDSECITLHNLLHHESEAIAYMRQLPKCSPQEHRVLCTGRGRPDMAGSVHAMESALLVFSATHGSLRPRGPRSSEVCQLQEAQ